MYMLGIPRLSAPVVGASFLILVSSVSSSNPAAQWIRNPAGSVDMSAATPRTADGKPDFSGIWTSDEVDPRRPNVPPNPRDATTSRRMVNFGVDLPGGLPYQPWLAALVKDRWSKNAKDDPHVKCLPDNFIRAYGMPHLLKFAQMPGLLVVLNEWNASYRQIFTDARPLPTDPNPSWMGYSSAKWSGDTLVVDTIGLRDDSWIDWQGSVVGETAKIREEIRRPNFGHLEIQLTVDDPKAYTKPFTVTIKERLIVEAELIDEICLENERSLQHMK